MVYQEKVEQEAIGSGEQGKGGMVGVIVGIDGYTDKKQGRSNAQQISSRNNGMVKN